MILDIHIHSNYSDGLNSPRILAKQVKKIGLDGFALVDHNTVKGLKDAKKAAKEFDLKFIPGLEISCLEGHVCALGIDKLIRKKSAVEAVEEIKDLGGVSVAVHPYDVLRHGVHDLVKSVKFDYIETFNSRTVFPFLNKKAEKVADSLKLKKVAGSDAHWYEDLGLGTIKVSSIEDLYRGKARIEKQEWLGLWRIAVEKTRRTIKKI